jgi:hypothetical protein
MKLEEPAMDITPAQYKKSFNTYINFINSLIKKQPPKY